MTDTTKERAQQFEIKLRTTRFLRAELDICCQLPSEVADQIMELYRAEQSTETPPRWIPVGEKLPEEIENGRRWVMVYDKDWDSVYFAFWTGEKWEPCEERDPQAYITHWQPLPSPPVAVAPRPVGTPEKCPECDSTDRRMHGFISHGALVTCDDPWHRGPVGTQTE